MVPEARVGRSTVLQPRPTDTLAQYRTSRSTLLDTRYHTLGQYWASHSTHGVCQYRTSPRVRVGT
eukprot:2132289-Rhodomonas_salina.1